MPPSNLAEPAIGPTKKHQILNLAETAYTSILLHEHLQKNKRHAKTPQIKTLIGHTSERGFGCASGREEGEKAHLNLLHASAHHTQDAYA